MEKIKIDDCFYDNSGSPDSGYNQYSYQTRKKEACIRKVKGHFKSQ